MTWIPLCRLYTHTEREGWGTSTFRGFSSARGAGKREKAEEQWNFRVRAERRKFLDILKEEHNVRSPEEWARVQKRHIEAAGGKALVKLFHGSIVDLLADSYPASEFKAETCRPKVPPNHWESPEKRREFCDSLAKKFGIKDAKGWKRINSNHIRGAGGRALLARYKDSVSELLKDVYPELEMDRETTRPKAPSGHWVNAENRKRFFDDLAAMHDVKELSDWRRVHLNDVKAAGGGGLLKRYNGSLTDALQATYEGVGPLTCRKKVPKGFWTIRENRIAVMESAAKSLGIKNPQDWKNFTTRRLVKLEGMRGLLRYYQDSLLTALQDLYPTQDMTAFSCRKTVPQGYWSEAANRRMFMDSIAEKYNVSSAADWKRVTTVTVQQEGGSGLLAKYPTFTALLQDIYQDRPEMISEDARDLRHVLPSGYWERQENVHAFLENSKDTLYIKEPSDWARVSLSQIRDLPGGTALLNQMKLIDALRFAYPDILWKEVEFESPRSGKTKKSAQRHLLFTIRHLVPAIVSPMN